MRRYALLAVVIGVFLVRAALAAPDETARDGYRRAARQLARIFREHPDHKLAGKSGLAAGNNWLHAGDYDRAIEIYRAVVAGAEKYDHAVVAQALYWLGDCLARTKKREAALQAWQRLSADYPETKWAKYARARLADGEE